MEHRRTYKHPEFANLQLHISPDRRFNSREEMWEARKVAGGYAELHFDNDVLFPSALEFWVQPQPSLHKRFQGGEVAVLKMDDGEGGHTETYIVEVQEDNGERILASIVPPKHIPVYGSRRSLMRSGPITGRQGKQQDAPWNCVQTVGGLALAIEIELDSESAIVRLAPADLAEIKEWLSRIFVHALYDFSVFPNAIVTKTAENPEAVASRILQGLKLFAPSHIEAGLSLYFGRENSEEQDSRPEADLTPIIVPTQYRFSWPETRSYHREPLAVDLPGGETVEALRRWISEFTRIEIAPDSLMYRALSRYSQSLNNENQVEVITHLVIGLETLLMPARDTEIRYRVRQRAGFMVGNSPLERIQFAALTNKAYGVRSGAVHTSEESSDATLEFADKCRDILRTCIRKLLGADVLLRNQFCQVAPTRRGRRDDKNEIHRFYEALVAFGDIQQALEYWRTPPSDAQSDSS